MRNFIILLISILGSSSVFAASKSSSKKAFEFRAHYSLYNTSNNKAFDDEVDTYVQETPDIQLPTGLGIDLTYQIDEIVIGARLELIEFKKSTYGQQAGIGAPIKKIDAELDGGRMGFLLGWRPIQWSKGYIGLMTHILPLSNAELTLDTQNTTTNAKEKLSFKSSGGNSFGAGLEGGVYVQDQFKAGVELGYTSFKSKSVADNTGADLVDGNGDKVNMDFSGPYGKFFVSADF